MKQSFLSLSLLLLSLSLLISNSAASSNPLSHKCPKPNTYYTPTEPFAANLNKLLPLLSKAAPPIGFALSSIGRGPNTVNGLALCRGDIKSAACKICIRSAALHIRRLCPNRRDAIVWLDRCMLRYSDAEFFGEVGTEHRFCVSDGPENETKNHNTIENTMKLMERLKTEAYLSPLLFASDVAGTVYGLAQCRRDLAGGDCKKCLETAIAELPGCCGGKNGGRVVGANCYLRFEMYPFFDS